MSDYAIPYPHEERVAARSLIKRLDDTHARIELMALGKIPINEKLIAGVAAMTETTDVDQQIQAMGKFARDHRAEHMSRLIQLAPNDLTAYAECMSPSEPPPRHLIFISERLMEIESGDRTRLMLSMPPGHAKDLDVGTMVTMGNGVLRRLGDIITGDMVISHTGQPCEVLATHDQGVRPVMRIITESGRTIRPHKDHVFLCGRGWEHAHTLSVGDTLAIPKAICCDYIEPARPREDFIFAGYMMARAVVTGRAYNRLARINRMFRCDDAAILADMKSVATALNFTFTQSTEPSYGRLCSTLRFDTRAKFWLKHRGLWDVKKDVLRIPDWIYEGSEADIAAFLGAIVSCDASFVPAPNQQTGKAKKISLSIRDNRDLAVDFQHLFCRVGINVRIRSAQWTNYNYRPTGFHKLEVVDAESQHLLARRLRLLGANKRFWDLPVAGVGFTHDTYITDRIVRIIEDDGECETRCLTIETDSSFLADGVIVHNSTYASRYYPSWYLGRKERRIYLQAGHSKPFAASEFGKKTRDLCMSDMYGRIFPGVGVRFDSKAAADWSLTNGNRYVAKGVGEGISGFRSTNNAVDDPYKDFASAQSPVIRKKVWEWFANDFMTRLLPNGNAFIITTRWHIDDVVGHIEEMIGAGEIKEPWEVINLPVFGNGDPSLPYFRHNLEPLWPDFYTYNELSKIKELQSSAQWACLYEGNPLPADGNIIKVKWLLNRWITYPSVKGDLSKTSIDAAQKNVNTLTSCIDKPETHKVGEHNVTLLDRGDAGRYKRTVLSVDSAEKDTQRADYSAVTVWRETPDGFHYLVYAYRERMEFPVLVSRVLGIAADWDADYVLMEEKGAGNQFIQHVNAMKEDKPAWTMVGINPGKDGKIFRMDSVAPIIEQGKLVLPLKTPWLAAVERELLQFPGSKNDDFADTVSQYLKWSRDTGKPVGGTKKLKTHASARARK